MTRMTGLVDWRRSAPLLFGSLDRTPVSAALRRGSVAVPLVRYGRRGGLVSEAGWGR